jgi:pimeloyl-ACP methyl ester carboxylesterase
MTTTTTHVRATGFGPVEVTVTERGEGHSVLLLHGGGGRLTVAAWADQLSGARDARVLTPTHPGFNGTPRPETLNTIRPLAEIYVELLAAIDVDDVTVVGNSIGGWISAEMALLASPRVSNYILVDAMKLATQATGRGGSGSADAKAQQALIVQLLEQHGATP